MRDDAERLAGVRAGWELLVERDGETGRICWMAVVPTRDLEAHQPNAANCACHPRLTLERTGDGRLVPYYVHSAHDGRELVERLGLQ